MTGKYDIEVYDNNVHYKFSIRRKITIICGNSASGKTVLINMIQNSEQSRYVTVTGAPCKVISASNSHWIEDISGLHDTILFLDEDCTFMKTKEFATIVKNSDCYFVLVTRKAIETLPYSVEEIYTIVEDKRYPKLKKTYNKLVRKYNDKQKPLKPDLILTEDS